MSFNGAAGRYGLYEPLVARRKKKNTSQLSTITITALSVNLATNKIKNN